MMVWEDMASSQGLVRLGDLEVEAVKAHRQLLADFWMRLRMHVQKGFRRRQPARRHAGSQRHNRLRDCVRYNTHGEGLVE